MISRKAFGPSIKGSHHFLLLASGGIRDDSSVQSGTLSQDSNNLATSYASLNIVPPSCTFLPSLHSLSTPPSPRLPSSSAMPHNITVNESTPRYSLFLALEDESTFESYCFVLKGQGSTFCLNVNCKVPSHKNQEKQDVEKGDIFIEKSPDAAWSRWCFNSSKLDSTLLAKWLSETNTCSMWNHIFQLAMKEIEVDETKKRKVTLDDIKSQEDHKIIAISAKTPTRKTKRKAMTLHRIAFVQSLRKLNLAFQVFLPMFLRYMTFK